MIPTVDARGAKATGEQQRTKPGKRSSRTGTPTRGLLPVVAALCLWQLFGHSDSPYFPPPSQWWQALVGIASSGDLIPALGWTVLSFFVGLVIATSLGAAVGVLVGSHRVADRGLGPTLEFLRIMPSAALVPVAALILGYTLLMKLVVVTMISVWPILLTCRSARRSMSPVLLDVPTTLGLTRWESLAKILFPAMIRPILLGVRVSAPLTLVITLLVEIVTGVPGLGALLGEAQQNFQSALVYGLLIVAGVLGYLVNWFVTTLEGRFSARLGAAGR